MKLKWHSVLTLILLTGGINILPAFSQDSLFNSSTTILPIVRSAVLPADEAFVMNALIEAPDTVVLFWDIKDGYYIYQKSISVSDAKGNVFDIGELEEGAVHTDEFFGEVNIYTDRLLHRFPLSTLNRNNNSVAFILQYQGCAEDLYCYPMQVREITLTLPE